MHLEHSPGDMIMVDFAGKKQHYTDPDTGVLIACEVFIAVLPYSGLTFIKPSVHSKPQVFLPLKTKCSCFLVGCQPPSFAIT